MNIGEEKKSDIEHFIQYSNLKYENEKTQKLRTFVFWYLKMQYSNIFLSAKAAPISRNVRSLVSQSVSKQIKKTQ